MHPWSMQSLGGFLAIILNKLLTSVVQSIMKNSECTCSQNLRVYVSKGTRSHDQNTGKLWSVAQPSTSGGPAVIIIIIIIMISCIICIIGIIIIVSSSIIDIVSVISSTSSCQLAGNTVRWRALSVWLLYRVIKPLGRDSPS